MTTAKFPYQLYLVLSQHDCKNRSFLSVAEEAILGGVDVIQLREKNCTQNLFLQRAQHLKEITDKYGVPLIINDNINVAVQSDAAGVHVGRNDMPPTKVRGKWNHSPKLLGYSIERLNQLTTPETRVSDYLGISPIFKTPTKPDTLIEWRLEGLNNIRTRTNKPLVAIGGMHKGNVGKVIKSGADCIAVVSAICRAENPRKVAYELKNEILKAN